MGIRIFLMTKFFSGSIQVFVFIIFLAVSIRLTGISTIPSGFHNDEASFFINAISLKESWHDEDNQYLPLYLTSFIDPKPALYSYLQIPFISLFGKSILAARLPGVILGVLSIIVIYFIFKSLIDQRFALVTIFLVSINPWHIVLSRGTQEVIMSFLFSLLAIFFLIRIFQKKDRSLLFNFLFIISTFLSLYSYHSSKVFLPMFFIFLIGYFGKKDKKTILVSCVVFFTCLFSLIFTTSHGGLVRANSVSIFSDARTQLILDEEIRTATALTPHFIIRIMHNKIVNYSLSFLSYYSDYFTGNFLFFKGGEPARLTAPFTGLFYLVEALLLLCGLFWGFVNPKYKKVSILFIVWLLIAPLSGALTVQEIPSITRTALLLVPILFFISISLITLFERRKDKILGFFIFLIICAYIGSIAYFANQYFVQSQVYHPWYRNYADERLVNRIQEIQTSYEHIYVYTGRDSYVYFVLNSLIPISTLQQTYPIRTTDRYTLGKYTFSKVNDCLPEKDPKGLSIISIRCKLIPGSGFRQIETINYKDTIPEYQLVIYSSLEDIHLKKLGKSANLQ